MNPRAGRPGAIVQPELYAVLAELKPQNALKCGSFAAQ
jgi:hypothetical protein